MTNQEPSEARGGLGRKFVGYVCVEHGGVGIVDQHEVVGSEDEEYGFLGLEEYASTEREDGHPHGVFLATGLGDGHYPVYADVMAVPGAGDRVARIVIDCLGTESDPASDALREDLVDIAHHLPDALRVTLPYDEGRIVEDEEDRRDVDGDVDEGRA